MSTIYFVVRIENHHEKSKYRSHTDLAAATAEAIRLSKDNPGCEFLVYESKAIGKVVNCQLRSL